MRGADGDLDLMFEQVDALRRLAHEVEHTDDEEHASALVYDFSIRWGTYVSGRLHRLELGHESGDLDEKADRRYRDLMDELRDVLPITRQLRLTCPTMAQEQPARGTG